MLTTAPGDIVRVNSRRSQHYDEYGTVIGTVDPEDPYREVYVQLYNHDQDASIVFQLHELEHVQSRTFVTPNPH